MKIYGKNGYVIVEGKTYKLFDSPHYIDYNREIVVRWRAYYARTRE